MKDTFGSSSGSASSSWITSRVRVFDMEGDVLGKLREGFRIDLIGRGGLGFVVSEWGVRRI